MNTKYIAVNGHVENREGAVVEIDLSQNYGVKQGFVGYGNTPEAAAKDADSASDWQSHIQGACGGNNPLCEYCRV